MAFRTLGNFISRRPGWVIAAWLAAAVGVTLAAPDLTRLVAENPAPLLPPDAESVRAAALVAAAWPDQASQSTVVLALHRSGGLADPDRAYARRVAARLRAADRPGAVLRVVGPDAAPEVAARLVSRDGTVQLVIVPLSTGFVSEANRAMIDWLTIRAREENPPAGLEVLWTGDALIGRDQMRYVQITLDRAAVATVVLLLIVLLAVYRSFWLALVPLATIGVSFFISRGLLAWMGQAGWELSTLVELFLIVILFGCGTDLCLLISWRFVEYWDPSPNAASDANDPVVAMRLALGRVMHALLTSVATVIVGLSSMGLNRFKLFSSTGPSVAIGLALTLVATLTLTPALLTWLARVRPGSFSGLRASSSGFWEGVGVRSLSRPVMTVLVLLALLAIPALAGLRADVVYDMVGEQPPETPAARNLRFLATKFGAGTLAPLTVVIVADQDLRQARGLGLIDDVSRFLARQPRLVEVRSATQPLGSTAPLEPARMAARLAEVRAGLAEIADGAGRLRDGIQQKAAALRVQAGLKKLADRLSGRSGPGPGAAADGDGNANANANANTPAADPLLGELGRAAADSGRIADGGRRAERAVAAMLEDPQGRSVLDHLLITGDDLREHPELQAALDVYLSRDGRLARIDLAQADLVFSPAGINQVDALRRRLEQILGDAGWVEARAVFTGANAEWSDIREQARIDRRQIWVIVPLGVYLVLLAALRDPWTCLNLVATMILTYAFALGVTALVFVHLLGDAGLDWKVPYFLFILLVAVGVDYNVFLMTRLREESRLLGLRAGIARAVGQTGGLITSAAAITACSFAAFMTSPLGSLRQLGFALVVGITVDAVLVRPVLVPCGHWLLHRHDRRQRRPAAAARSS
jgi:RND superfamily putative drug exporter